MFDHADQLSGSIARQARVAVERDAVANMWQDDRLADTGSETRIRGTPQQSIELFDLAALTFPTHP
ncbi:MAG: hypothetical protein KDB18_13250, partial [Salinibacterium sp.]|nr:hypothetical protein [Salinibacterium sp.]